MAIFNVESVKNAPLNSVVDEGTYNVRIVSVKTGASKVKGTPSIDLEYEIEAGPEQIDNRMIEGKKVFQHIYFGDNHEVSDKQIKKLCKCTGVEIESVDQILADLPGRELKIVIKHREYQGEAQEEIKDFKEL
jgi:hypothetical protein